MQRSPELFLWLLRILPPMEAMNTDRAVEWDWTDSQGRTFHLQCSPMTDSAGERMIMVLGIDITARQQAEDALKRAHDKLEDRVKKTYKRTRRSQHQIDQQIDKTNLRHEKGRCRHTGKIILSG